MRNTAFWVLTYDKEMRTEHRLVPEGLQENSAAYLYGITVVSVSLNSDKRKISCIAANYKNYVRIDKKCHEIT